MAEKRKREDVVHRFFNKKKVIDCDGKEVFLSWCSLCGEAGKPFKCDSTFNLSRHLMNKHKKEAEENGLSAQEEQVIEGDAPVRPNRVTVPIDKNIYVTSLVRWVTECNIPMNFFAKKCATDVLGPIESGLKLNSVSRKNIMRYVEVVEARMTTFIRDQVKSKFVCIKADIASRKGRSVLGINCQFVIKGRIVVRTLAMVERPDRNTAENIFNDIKKVLDKFGIDLKQVYSITTDNGKNFLKTSLLMRNAQMIVLSESEMQFLPECDQKIVENSFVELENLDEDGDDIFEVVPETDTNDDIDDDTEFLNFSADETVNFDQNPDDDLPIIEQPHLVGVRCAAHDVQLSVYDVIKQKTVSKFLAKVRKLVKILRAQPYVNSFKVDKTRNMPVLDGETRWGSAYVMVKRIEEQKDFVQGLLAVELQREFNDTFWMSVERFVKATFPVYLLTKRIQEESLTCGTMYLYWKECCLELTDMNDSLGNKLLDALQKRQNMWFDNPAFIAALFVDPRLNDFDPPVLTQDQKEEAVQHLLKTWNAMRTVTKTNSTSDDNPVPSTSTGAGVFSRIEKLLCTNRQHKSSEIGEMEKRIRRIPLEMFAPLDTDVIKWWEAKKLDDKELSDLAIIVSQLPCTQVSVERTFNGLGHILTKARMKLGSVSLEQILFVKANSDIFDDVYFHYDL